MNFANDGAFKAAQKAFRATLSIKDQALYAACDTPAELLRSLQNLETLTEQGQKRRLTRCLKVLERLNTRLQTYFDALNVIAGAHDAAALVYGAVRVVLQLASALPTFFDRLLSAIGRLADTFPQYEAILNIFDGNPSLRMRQHLEKVYQDFFEFLRLAAKVFTASSGRIKRPVEMIANVIWKPFATTFSDILAQIDYHRVFILEELEILQAQRAKDADRAALLERSYADKERLSAEENRRRTKELEGLTKGMKQAQEREIKDSSVRRIAEWLAAPLFAETLEHSQEHRIENTSQWIFQKDEFIKWTSTEVDMNGSAKWKKMPPWVLWAHGNPGCGKTVMASSVYDELVEEKKSQQLGHMILHRCREESDILDKFLFIQSDSETSSGQAHATAKQLYDLMCISAQALGHIEFVVDGIDETDNPNGVSESLKVLVKTAPIKLICFSRSNVSRLQYIVPTQQRIAFNRELTSPDIRAFLEGGISNMVEENKLPTTVDIESLVDTLLNGADGMFLWARLMIHYLRSPALSRSTRLRVIQDVRLPEGLNAMYDRIASLIMGSSEPELKLAKDILLWMQHSKKAYHSVALLDWLRTAVGYDCNPDENNDFVTAAIAVCNGLVEFSDSLGGFSFTHLTVSEYLDIRTFSDSGREVLLPDSTTIQIVTASRCLEHLMEIAPSELPLDCSLRTIYKSDEARFKFQTTSFESHAIKEWLYGLSTIRPKTETRAEPQHVAQLKATITRFLGSPLALGVWIENLYATREDVQGIVHLITGFTLDRAERLLNNTDVKLAKQLATLSQDLQSIETKWGRQLQQKPYLIWSDVMIFSKFETLSRLDTSTFGTVSNLTPKCIKDNTGCNIPPLCSISSTSSDARMTGALSIIPSAEFVQFWRSSNNPEAYTQGESFCKGWVANYEIWSQDSKSRLASFQIPLPQKEIMTLFRQSFREEAQVYVPVPEESVFLNGEGTVGPGNYKTSFPLAIGPDCLTLSVLRSVYRILPDQSNPMTRYESSLVPLECLDHFQTQWGEELQVFDPNCHGRIPKFFHIKWRDWYTYSISFSLDSRMLSFADYRKPCEVNLVVFVVHHAPTLSLQCIQSTKARLGQPRVKEMHFHPWKTLLVFLAETKVWLWDFGGRATVGPVHLKTEFDGCHEETKTLVNLSFSVCGNFVLARNSIDTVVLHLPKDTLPDTDIVQGREAVKRKRSADELESNPSLGSLVHLGSDQGLPERTLSGTHLFMAGDTPRTVTLISEENNISLGLSTQDPLSEVARRQLFALPNTIDTKDKAISVNFPETHDGQLRIILNKTAMEGYTLDEDRCFSHPTVIEKNMRLVETIITSTTSGPSRNPAKRFCGLGLLPHPVRTEGDDYDT